MADELAAARLSRPRDAAAYAAVLERAIAMFEDDPVSADAMFDLADLYDQLWPEYERLGRVEDALAAADAAVTAGLRSEPDPRCLRAEILMRAGRVAEAEPIWAAVHADTPNDVWLYNNAGLEYGAAGHHATALSWLTGGLQLALDSGDPNRLVDQLAHHRQGSLTALNQAKDELQTRAATVLTEQHDSPAGPASHWAVPPVTHGVGPAGPATPPAGTPRAAWAWFPADQYQHALDAWPDLADHDLVTGPDGGQVSHPQYCRRMQHRLTAAAQPGMRIEACGSRSPRSTWQPSPPGVAPTVGSRGRMRGPPTRPTWPGGVTRR